jgi:putative MATE family efflux protein
MCTFIFAKILRKQYVTMQTKDHDNTSKAALDWRSSPEAAVLLPVPSDEPELTTMPLSRAIFKLAGPAIGSMIFIMIFGLVDIWWVGKLGAEQLAGVSAASFLVWALESVAMLVSTGVNALVARYIGAKENEKANLVIGQAIILATIIALSSTAFGLILQKAAFTKMGLEGVVLDAALDYMNVILYGIITIFLAFTLDAAFRGMGDTKTPLKIISVALTLNMILDPLLIFGYGPIPQMGAQGAALATIIAHALIVFWAAALLRKREIHFRFRNENNKFYDWGVMWRLTKIGAPVAVNGFLFSLSYMALTRIITGFGSGALAAIGIGHRIEGLSYNIAVGFSFAAATLIGQNLGANKPERAEKAVWLNILYISIFLAGACAIFFFYGGYIFRFFINDPEVIAEGVTYLKIIAIFEIFLGFEIVLEGAFGGAGDTMPPMLISVPLTWARIPLAIFLAHNMGMGSVGVWWAISITTGLKGILLAVWFRRGRWKEKKV